MNRMCIFGFFSNIVEMQNEEIKKFLKTDKRKEHENMICVLRDESRRINNPTGKYKASSGKEVSSRFCHV